MAAPSRSAHGPFAVSAGWVWLADDSDGVAVWLPGGVGPPPGYDRRTYSSIEAARRSSVRARSARRSCTGCQYRQSDSRPSGS